MTENNLSMRFHRRSLTWVVVKDAIAVLALDSRKGLPASVVAAQVEMVRRGCGGGGRVENGGGRIVVVRHADVGGGIAVPLQARDTYFLGNLHVKELLLNTFTFPLHFTGSLYFESQPTYIVGGRGRRHGEGVVRRTGGGPGVAPAAHTAPLRRRRGPLMAVVLVLPVAAAAARRVRGCGGGRQPRRLPAAFHAHAARATHPA